MGNINNIGKIIVIEGACDGIGKTTQYEMLKDRLEKEGNKIATHHFPSYGTPHGEAIEDYLKGKYGKPEDISPYYVNLLYATDRGITWYNKLKEAYSKGIVLLDRYTSSSIIYQSSIFEKEEEKVEFMDFVTDYEFNKIGIGKPDLTIFLFAPFDLVTKLRRDRTENEGVENDIHEADLKFMRKVYNTSVLAAKHLGWTIVNCATNGKMKTIEEIHEEIYTKINVMKEDNDEKV